MDKDPLLAYAHEHPMKAAGYRYANRVVRHFQLLPGNRIGQLLAVDSVKYASTQRDGVTCPHK